MGMYVCEQVIYVDADQVLRADLKELWDMDLKVQHRIGLQDTVSWPLWFPEPRKIADRHLNAER